MTDQTKERDMRDIHEFNYRGERVDIWARHTAHRYSPQHGINEMAALQDRVQALLTEFRGYGGPRQAEFRCLSYILDDLHSDVAAEISNEVDEWTERGSDVFAPEPIEGVLTFTPVSEQFHPYPNQSGSTLAAGNPHPATAAVPDRGAVPPTGSPVSFAEGV